MKTQLLLAAACLAGCVTETYPVETDVPVAPQPRVEVSEPADGPIIWTAECFDGWAVVKFPSKSIPELSYVRATGKLADVPPDVPAGFYDVRVNDIRLRTEHVAARCSSSMLFVTFVLSEDLDIGD